MLASGYGNNPNTQTGLGYVKVTLADGRHWDLMAGRPVTVGERADLSAGPMSWTCVEPLKKWKLEVAPNDSGVQFSKDGFQLTRSKIVKLEDSMTSTLGKVGIQTEYTGDADQPPPEQGSSELLGILSRCGLPYA